jgi:predicted nucleic acid-binding protein
VPERIILDSSVVIAAALNTEGPTQQFMLDIDEVADLEIIWSQKLGYELHEKFYGTGTVAAEVEPVVKQFLLEWLDDDYLIALARRKKAWLVTYDSRLIASSPDDVNVVRPDELLHRLTRI